MSSYGLDLSPAQAPLNCFGPSLSSRILSRLRPRHARKTEYNNRLREGDALMTEARDVFHACQHALGHETRTTIQVNLEGLRIERDGLYKFSDYRGSQQAEEGAVSRAEAYRINATRVHAMVTAARNAALSASGNLHARGLSTSMHSPSGSRHSGSGSGSGTGIGTSTRRVSSEHAHASGRSNPASLPRTPPYAEPLHMLQTPTGPVTWVPGTPASGNNILGLDARGVRASPRTSFKSTVLRTTPAGSILSLDMALVGISSMQRSPTSLHGSPADSVGAYSLGSDGFPRPSRRAPQRRGTIQSTTSLPRSNPSRQGSAQTHSSHASSASGGRLHSSRQSSVQTGTHSNHSRPSLDSAKHPGSYQSRRSDDRRGRPAYARAPSSLRTSSVPPENRASPYGVPRITDSPGQYYH
ncbi:hypothetical protein V8D89_013144 [Ganoderma adspersum]